MPLVEVLEDFDVVRVRADNASLLSLDGTNTWMIGRDPCWVVDPGPLQDSHLDAVDALVSERGGAGGVVLTHSHADHSEGADAMCSRLGASLGDPGPLEVMPLPGHADDHVVFLWRDVCLAGDCVLGAGSVFVAGDMGAYLDGLRALRARDLALIGPGHGPAVLDPNAKLDEYLAHRLDRESKLLAALDSGLRTDDELLDAAWSDAPPQLRPAAQLTMQAHLRKLATESRLPPDLTVPPPPTDLPHI